MKRVQVRRPVQVLAVLIVLLWADHTGWIRMALAACCLHELGHVLVYRRCYGVWPELTVSLRGIALRMPAVPPPAGQLLVLACAGPGMNFAVSALVLLAMQKQASYGGYLFASANLCTGMFNLLPLGTLDGRRILQALWGQRGKITGSDKI